MKEPHRLVVSHAEYIGITEGPQPARTAVDCDGYKKGDEVYFLYYEGDRLKYLARRKIVSIAPGREAGECIISLQ